MLALALAACVSEEPVEVLDLVVETDDATPGVATVRFATSVDAAARVVASGAGGSAATPLDAGGREHAIEVRGLVLGETYELVVEASAGERSGSAAETLEVGRARADLPVFERTTWAPDRACGEGWLLTTMLTLGGQSWVVVLDREGRPVWARPGEARDWLARVRPTRDGSGLAWLHNDPVRQEDFGRITRVTWAGELVSETRALQAHHDFVERPEGGWAWLSYVFAEGVEVDGVVRDVATDAILEAPEGGAEGDAVEVFSMLEDYPPGLFDPGTTVAEAGFVPGYWEFSHGNSLMLDEDGETYHAMFRWLDALIEVDRASGAMAWQLGGLHSDFTGPDGEAFSHGHMSDLWDGGFLVFDNADRTGAVSGAARYAVDEEARTWDRTWDARDPEGRLEILLGDAIRMREGCDNVLVAWATSSRVDEIGPDGEVVWTLQAPPGWIVGRLSWITDLYAPGEG